MFIRYSSTLIIVASLVVLPITNPCYGQTIIQEKESIVDFIVQGKMAQLVRQTEQEIKQAQRLIKQFELQEEYNSLGQLMTRNLADGNQEHYRYYEKNDLAIVRVVTAQQEFIEERTYYQRWLTSVLQSDGQLKTIHYQNKSNPQQAMPVSCQIITYGDHQIRSFEYDHQGNLQQACYSNGKNIPLSQVAGFNHISRLIKPELLRLGVVD